MLKLIVRTRKKLNHMILGFTKSASYLDPSFSGRMVTHGPRDVLMLAGLNVPHVWSLSGIVRTFNQIFMTSDDNLKK